MFSPILLFFPVQTDRGSFCYYFCDVHSQPCCSSCTTTQHKKIQTQGIKEDCQHLLQFLTIASTEPAADQGPLMVPDTVGVTPPSTAAGGLRKVSNDILKMKLYLHLPVSNPNGILVAAEGILWVPW